MAVFEHVATSRPKCVGPPLCRSITTLPELAEGSSGAPSNRDSLFECGPLLVDNSSTSFSTLTDAAKCLRELGQGFQKIRIQNAPRSWADTHAQLTTTKSGRTTHGNKAAKLQEHCKAIIGTSVVRRHERKINAQLRDPLERKDSSKTAETSTSSFGESWHSQDEGNEERDEATRFCEEPFPVIQWESTDEDDVSFFHCNEPNMKGKGHRRYYSMNESERRNKAVLRFHDVVHSFTLKRNHQQILQPARSLKRCKSFSSSLCSIETNIARPLAL